MKFFVRTALMLVLTASFCTIGGGSIFAQQADAETSITHTERVSLARDFISRMRRGFNKAENILKPAAPVPSSAKKQSILPEGEQLLFQVFLAGRLKLDNVIFGDVKNQKIRVSLRDFTSTLELPISVNANEETASGWYIREQYRFALDGNAGTAISDQGEFTLSENVEFTQDDIFVPIEEIEQWFDFEVVLDVSSLNMIVKSARKLPIQERYERSKREEQVSQSNEPQLPLREDHHYDILDVPFVDVSTSSTYSKNGNTDRSSSRHSANIATSGDFLYGNLRTQTLITDEDKVTNIRATYKQESLKPDLLGPLKAKKFEVGDVLQARVPIDNAVSQELGVRVTNTDPLRVFTNPTTAISGNVFPGWDVELYRGAQFLGFQRVDDNGFYNFDDVILFSNENNFKLVFYGPQGEVREELLSVPVDLTNLAEGGMVYDVSLTFDGEQTYRKNDIDNEDEGTPSLFARVEKPLAPGTVAVAALRSNEVNGERNYVGYGGLSTLLGETLVNANLGVDDEAELATELTARRSFGEYDFFGSLDYTMDNFDTITSGDDSLGGLQASLRSNGPLPIGIGKRPQYTAGYDYNLTNDGDVSTTSRLGFNTAFKNINFNDQLTYKTSDLTEDSFNNLATLSGRFGKNRVRVISDYQIHPESQLQSVTGTLTHDFTRKLDLDLELQRRINPISLTEFSAQLNWLAGFARISPSVRYNSEEDFFAGLNTNFGLAREPFVGNAKNFDRNITRNGGISTFVFLDKDGDGVFNGADEPIPEVSVRALQNGGLENTDENGIAFFNRVSNLKQTDVYVIEESLKDPYWISGYDGVSIIPREGHVAEIQFPIHISSELDGTVFARRDDSRPVPLRSVKVHLYNADGEIEQTAKTDIGGFYLFSRVPPGRYLLSVDADDAKNGNFARPMPQQIELGYEGTIIYGNDIYVDAGEKDVPSEIIAGLEDYKKRHPHIDFTNSDYDIVLNMGEYNSRLLMSTVWYRLHTRYRQILTGGELLVLPQHSYADVDTGKHALRVGFRNTDVNDAYNRCRALIARDIACTVEVLPAGAAKLAMKQQ